MDRLSNEIDRIKVGTDQLRKIIQHFPEQRMDSASKSSPLLDQRDALNQQLASGFRRRDKAEVLKVFNAFAETTEAVGPSRVSRDKIHAALMELGVVVDGQEAVQILKEIDTDHDGLDLKGFESLLQRPNRLYELAKTLPLCDILADSIPRKSGVDPLRVVSSLTAAERDIVCDTVRSGLDKLLKEWSEQLKDAFKVTDHRRDSGVGSKFNIVAVSCGDIDDFHAGVEERIGENSKD
jgi:hypothetical protein